MESALTGRDARTHRIGEELLVAAREQFLAEGYHGTSLDRIAAAAGYTKGAVYTRFRSKADLFLALLEERVMERAEQNRELAAGLSGVSGLGTLARRWAEVQRNDLHWTLLVVEFRVHAARDIALAARYDEIHQRVLQGIAEIIASVLGAETPAARRRCLHVAQVLHSLGNGAALEQASDSEAYQPAEGARLARMVVEELT